MPGRRQNAQSTLILAMKLDGQIWRCDHYMIMFGLGIQAKHGQVGQAKPGFPHFADATQNGRKLWRWGTTTTSSSNIYREGLGSCWVFEMIIGIHDLIVFLESWRSTWSVFHVRDSERDKRHHIQKGMVSVMTLNLNRTKDSDSGREGKEGQLNLILNLNYFMHQENICFT